VVGSTTSVQIYRVRDIGKPGVPVLTSDMKQTVALITHYFHPSTLRFAIDGDLFVFDPYPNQVCAGMGFFSLAGSCYEYFLPSDPIDVTATGPDCDNHKRPWIAGDRGTGSSTWWAAENNH
jgi:hypothetical protein